MTASLRILAADDEATMRDYLRELLPRLGHQVVVAESGRQLVELCRAAPPDLVITDIKMGEPDGLKAAAQINQDRKIPVIIVSAHHEPALRARANEEHVMAYLIKPIKQADLESAIDLAMKRFRETQALRQEAAELRQALEDRKIIERAKGVVSRRLGVDEAESFRRLRKLASNQNRRLIDIAQTILDAEKTFEAIEHVALSRGS